MLVQGRHYRGSARLLDADTALAQDGPRALLRRVARGRTEQEALDQAAATHVIVRIADLRPAS